MNLLTTLLRTAPAVHPEPTWSDALARVKYCARGLLTPGLTAEWFGVLNSPGLTTLVERNPHIFSKLQRPYLHRRLNSSERLTVLKRHYNFVRECFDDATCAKIFSESGYVLSPVPVPEAETFSLRLFYSNTFAKEGELSLGLFNEGNPFPLFTLTFCANGYGTEGPQEIFVGGLQGPKTSAQRELIINLTRAMHGLRPKALLVAVLQQLCQIWGFATIRAVGGGEHIYRHARKRKTLHASYDEFWLECLGNPLPDGNFQLPVDPPERDLTELSRNKRPVYRRRYAMLAEIKAQLSQRFPAVVKPSPALAPLVILQLELEENAALVVEEIAFEAL